MGDPISMLAIGSMVAGVAGAGVSAAGQYGSMEAQSSNAAYQAQVAANNATIAGRNANMDLQSGETAVTNRGMKTRQQVGTEMAGQSGSGVDVNSGSFVNSRAATSEIGALDALTIRSNTAKKVYADETQQSNFQAQGGLLTNESEQASAAAPVVATGSLLSSASSVGGSYFKFLQNAPGGAPATA
jgi:hypothetical protein